MSAVYLDTETLIELIDRILSGTVPQEHPKVLDLFTWIKGRLRADAQTIERLEERLERIVEAVLDAGGEEDD